MLHNCMLDLHNCVLCLPVSGTVVWVALNINMQVLTLGKEDVNVTWEPVSSLPQAVVECTAVQQNSDFYGKKPVPFTSRLRPYNLQLLKGFVQIALSFRAMKGGYL